MAELRRGEDGVWTLHLEDNEPIERNEVHDEALPRYVTAFDGAVTKAEEACESEFVKALLHVGGVQDAGWDPYESTRRAIPAMIRLHEQVPEGPEHFETARHLQLWTYAHIIEASEPYSIIADMLDIANGGFFWFGRCATTWVINLSAASITARVAKSVARFCRAMPRQVRLQTHPSASPPRECVTLAS
jgi:hypothetical protein